MFPWNLGGASQGLESQGGRPTGPVQELRHLLPQTCPILQGVMDCIVKSFHAVQELLSSAMLNNEVVVRESHAYRNPDWTISLANWVRSSLLALTTYVPGANRSMEMNNSEALPDLL